MERNRHISIDVDCIDKRNTGLFHISRHYTWYTTTEQVQNDFSACQEQHGKISYVRVHSTNIREAHVRGVIAMVKQAAIPLCLGSETIATDCKKTDTVRFRLLSKLIRDGFDTVEIPVAQLDDKELMAFIRDHFGKKVVRVWVKKFPWDPANSLETLKNGAQSAKEYGADHIVLEGGTHSGLYFYHPQGIPNFLLVDEIMEQVGPSVCIIGWNNHIWREIYGEKMHIGDLKLNNVNDTRKDRTLEGHWSRLGEFRRRIKKIIWESDYLKGLKWDTVAASEVLNRNIAEKLPELADAQDEILEELLKDTPFLDSDLRWKKSGWLHIVVSGSGKITIVD